MIPPRPMKIDPMPQVRGALLDVTEARKALERGEEAWNLSQLEDAIRSAEFFIKAAREAMQRRTESTLPKLDIPEIAMPTPARRFG